MKVLHLLKSNKYSGAENVVLSIMDMCPEIEMVYASPDGSIRQVVEGRNHRFYSLKSVSIRDVKCAIKELQPDIIHAHDFSMASAAAWASGKIPVVAHLHNNPPWLKKADQKSIAFALSLPKIQQVISVSRAVEDEYIFHGLMKDKNTVVGNVVDAENVREKAQDKVDCKQVDLVFLGRLTPQKCPILFCEIVKEVKKTVPQITARMIGDGELRPQVEKYINKHDLEGTIELAGFKSNPYPYMKAGRVMVMPSAWEGFGLAVVEGMCLGKPVVCSGAGGLADIVDDSCGAICGTVQEYASEIIRLLEEPELYEKKSMEANRASLIYGDAQSYKDKVFSVYAKVRRKEII